MTKKMRLRVARIAAGAVIAAGASLTAAGAAQAADLDLEVPGLVSVGAGVGEKGVDADLSLGEGDDPDGPGDDIPTLPDPSLPDPDDPDDPNNPGGPGGDIPPLPDVPVDPGQPEDPGTPDNPGTPGDPGTPDQPSNPGDNPGNGGDNGDGGDSGNAPDPAGSTGEDAAGGTEEQLVQTDTNSVGSAKGQQQNQQNQAVEGELAETGASDQTGFLLIGAATMIAGGVGFRLLPRLINRGGGAAAA
ncbi:LPXTG cell wall anchor domain-containing protein [Streptomyces pathocidini]|uniref:LPXTG cell wall anchor domain-containing protein n=1 Tax=Streptomyces pathocidini TaxID=1650571 RepID=UPI0033FFD623